MTFIKGCINTVQLMVLRSQYTALPAAPLAEENIELLRPMIDRPMIGSVLDPREEGSEGPKLLHFVKEDSIL